MKSKTLKPPIVVISTATISTFRIEGSVMYQKALSPRAPSSAAAW